MGHTGGRAESQCSKVTQMLGGALLVFLTGMPVRGNTNQNFRAFTRKLTFAVWKNTSFSKLLLYGAKVEKQHHGPFSLPDFIWEKSCVPKPVPGCFTPASG